MEIIDDLHKISGKHGNGQLRRRIWVDAATGRVTRYQLAYLNPSLFADDGGRVVGYDHAADGLRRHYFGAVETIGFASHVEIEARFEQDWLTLKDRP
jgi:hypothetical protein